MTTDSFKPGDRIEYAGSYINARGVGTLLSYEQEGSTTWAVIRTNGTVHRVMPGGLQAAGE